MLEGSWFVVVGWAGENEEVSWSVVHHVHVKMGDIYDVAGAF